MLRVMLVCAWLLPSCSSTAPPDARREPSEGSASGVVGWLTGHGVALQTVEPGRGFDDLSAFGSMVGDARVVALGEATHGSHEVQRLKHRLIEYLVSEKGFSLVAIEANQPECRAINEYVLHGTGDARAALDGIYFWSLNTEEMLALIEWMRAWNAGHDHKVQFAGFDMQRTEVARANVAAFVASRALRTAAIDPVAFADARHDLTILQQEAERRVEATVLGRFAVRDRAMADNVEWLLRQQPRDARIVVWAHNVHVALDIETRRSMGNHLRARLGDDYVAFGLLFGHGTVRAIGDDVRRGPIDFEVERAAETDVTAPFARAGKPLLMADLREVPATGRVRAWFDAPHLGRELGARFAEINTPRVMVLPRLYDGVIYIDHVTSTRSLARYARTRAPQ